MPSSNSSQERCEARTKLGRWSIKRSNLNPQSWKIPIFLPPGLDFPQTWLHLDQKFAPYCSWNSCGRSAEIAPTTLAVGWKQSFHRLLINNGNPAPMSAHFQVFSTPTGFHDKLEINFLVTRIATDNGIDIGSGPSQRSSLLFPTPVATHSGLIS